MQEIAAHYAAYFEFELRAGGMRVMLSAEAPGKLLDLAQSICGDDAERLVSLYEALNCIAEAEDPQCCDIDEKICPPEMVQVVRERLRADSGAN